jgi:excisionase family DNA binding protein
VPTTPLELVSITEAADRLSLSTKTVRRMISRGDLPARRLGARAIRIDASDLTGLGRALAAAKG